MTPFPPNESDEEIINGLDPSAPILASNEGYYNCLTGEDALSYWVYADSPDEFVRWDSAPLPADGGAKRLIIPCGLSTEAALDFSHVLYANDAKVTEFGPCPNSVGGTDRIEWNGPGGQLIFQPLHRDENGDMFGLAAIRLNGNLQTPDRRVRFRVESEPSVDAGHLDHPPFFMLTRLANPSSIDPESPRPIYRIAPDKMDQAQRDLRTVRDRMVKPLLEEPGDTDRARDLLQTQTPEGTWPDIDYSDTVHRQWAPASHAQRIKRLAHAYSAPASPLHRQEEVRAAAENALRWWVEHDLESDGWWWPQIGVPRALAPALLLMEDELPDDLLQGGIEELRKAPLGMSGQNLIWGATLTVKRAILSKSPELALRAARMMADEIRITLCAGIQPDMSFHQHRNCLYSHGYGANFSRDNARLAHLFRDTMFAYPQEKLDLLTRYVLDGQQWMARQEFVDYGATGRNISRRGVKRYLGSVAEALLKLPTGREQEIRDLGARATGEDAPPLVGNKHFWHSDIMTHHRPEYYASARMHSTRVDNTDWPCNDEGLKNHHIADGCNFIMRRGDEYKQIVPVWDWRKIPGTTVDQKSRMPEPGRGGPRRSGETSFVGGVSNGHYGLAAFDFVRNQLSARKSWFFFDGEFVCLGAGISCGTDHPVATTLNQCLLNGSVLVDGREVEPGEHVLEEIEWIHHDGTAYVPLEADSLHLTNRTENGDWHDINHRYEPEPAGRDVFTLWIDHGDSPQNARYAYIVAPGMEPDRLDEYVNSSPIVVVNNEPHLQTVHHHESQLTGMAFYEAGTAQLPGNLTLQVDTPCLALLKREDGALQISLSNPENEPATVEITINRKLEGQPTSDAADATRLTFDLPDEAMAGSSVTRRFSVVE